MLTSNLSMKTRTLISLLAALLLGASSSLMAAKKPMITVLSTDIGSDVDDTWALAQILRSPELDLRMVLTETGQARFRGEVTAKFLEIAGRTDVEIALGVDYGVMSDEHRHQGPWVKDYALENYPGTVHQDGVQAFIDFVRGAEGIVQVIAIGPPPSLAEALRRAPEIATKCRLLGMHGSFDLGYGGSPKISAETNVRVNPEAFRTMMAANWDDALLTPLDTCGLVNLEGEDYHAVWCATDDPVLRALIENYCVWAPRVPWMKCDFFTTKSSTLFDCVAVYMAYATDLLNFEVITFSVTDDGFTVRNPNGEFTAKVAISWKDQAAFERHLSRRLLGLE